MKIYTKTGDHGETGLFGGPRVRKDSARIEAYGTVDELNAAIGLARCESLPESVDQLLARVQNELFNVGAELATPDPQSRGMCFTTTAHVERLEADIDHYESLLPKLTQFILPGGTRGAATLHLARNICRRAERRLVTLKQHEPVSAELLAYLNRLSDLLFVLARATNAAHNHPDIAWEKPAPGE